jgi:hypothetical protein
MKLVSMCVAIALFASVAVGATMLRVCESDGVTPFDDREIMVGTRLTFIVSSDSEGYWSGGLFLLGQNRVLGLLSARDADPNSRDWTGSHYPAAGDLATVSKWNDSYIWGFDMYTDDSNSISGDWFIFDYEAIGAGEPNVAFYEYDVSWDDPNYFVNLVQSPTRDFNDDGTVNLLDYSELSFNWLAEDCNNSNWCDKTDITMDGYVDIDDMALFADYWLWDTSHVGPYGAEPPEGCQEDPNIIYSLVDVNDLSEITMDVGEMVTLYVTMETSDRDMGIFQIEVNISDPNLGFIDNTPYDANDPPGTGTARILADPRSSGFDYWGPGIAQTQGIQFFAASISSSISDGDLASFQYTSQVSGDVTLELINWSSSGDNGELCPTLENIVIHQIDPFQQQPMSMGMDSMLISSQESVPLAPEDMAEWLETIWIEGDLSETFSEEEWNAFVESVRETTE